MADSSGSGTGAASSSGSVFSHEADELIASNKVEGTAVYNRQGARVGTLHHFMVGKRSGQVAYAIMSFGGFMGLGEKHYPLPWNELTYDKTKGGYVIANPPGRLTVPHAARNSGGIYRLSASIQSFPRRPRPAPRPRLREAPGDAFRRGQC